MKANELEKRLDKKKHKTTSELKRVISTRADQNPNFCLFLGAGASRNSSIRTAGEMISEWRESVYRALSNEENDKDVSEIIKWLSDSQSDWYDEKREYASLIEHIYPTPTNRRKFIETEVADKIPSIGYAYLVRIAEAGFLKTIFTTNFDDLLNEAFYQFSSERAIVCAHDSSVRSISVTSRRAKIIKLHGDYLFEGLKNTYSETQNLEENMKDKLTEFLKEYGLILAGYSGSDKSITGNLEILLSNSQYLQNGLYWCFRENDNITDEALEILRKPNSFYVITPGFDELMADLYSMLATESTPFSSKFASDRASNIINTYLSNEQLKSSTSKTIKKHLENLESDKNASLVSDMMMELNAEQIASAGLSDQNLMVYLEIERAVKDRNPEAALARLDEELAKTGDRRFKEMLLHRRFVCSTQLHKLIEAKAAVKEMLSLEPANFYVSLGECSLIENRSDRVVYLQRLADENPFSATVLYRYAQELRRAIEVGDKSVSSKKMDDVVSVLKRSAEVDPKLDNPAWYSLSNIFGKGSNTAKKDELLSEIVDRHLLQDAYSPDTTSILVHYCRKLKKLEFKEKQIFAYLQEAYEHHFPRNYPAHLSVFVEACTEFGGVPLLLKLLEEAREKDDVKDDPQFVMLMMGVYYDVMRDLSGAISCGRDSLRKNNKISVERRLLSLYLAKGSYDKAREMHNKLKGAIDDSQWLSIDAKILEYEEKYQNAIDIIEILPDRRDFDEQHVPYLSFLELKMGMYGRVIKRCKTFLEKRIFNLKFENVIINYEYAKKMDKGKISLERIAKLADSTESEMVKGVCYSLLGQDDKALSIFSTEAGKKFSLVDDCLRWPVISRHEKELRGIRDDLLKSKRSFTTSPGKALLTVS